MEEDTKRNSGKHLHSQGGQRPKQGKQVQTKEVTKDSAQQGSTKCTRRPQPKRLVSDRSRTGPGLSGTVLDRSGTSLRMSGPTLERSRTDPGPRGPVQDRSRTGPGPVQDWPRTGPELKGPVSDRSRAGHGPEDRSETGRGPKGSVKPSQHQDRTGPTTLRPPTKKEP